MVSDIETKDATLLLPPGTQVWQSRVRGEWWERCNPYTCVYSQWVNSSQELAMKYVVKRMWEQHLSLQANATYNAEFCPHFDYLSDAPDQ